MNRWQDAFQVTTTSIWADEHVLRCKITGNVLATYKDRRYAIKQAKFRFKKMQKSVEKILLK